MSNLNSKYAHKRKLEKKLLNLTMSESNKYNYSPQYLDRNMTKSDSMSRKIYTFSDKIKHHGYLHNSGNYMRSPVTNPPFWKDQFTSDTYNLNNVRPHSQMSQKNMQLEQRLPETAYVYDNNCSDSQDANGFPANPPVPVTDSSRPRALSFTGNRVEAPRKLGKSIRDRNLRRQSYNPRVVESSSSESECTSLSSAVHSDLELRRRRYTSNSTVSRLSTSNSSIRSDLLAQTKMRCSRSKSSQFLKPDMSGSIKMSKSPPPSQNALSGLSPTTAARWQHDSDTSSDSSL